jgi:hypothetical protein
LFLLRNRTFQFTPGSTWALTLLTGAGYILESYSIFEPGSQSENACGFLRRLFEMLVEIITAAVLIQGGSILSQLIERRRDVLYYVSRPDPR